MDVLEAIRRAMRGETTEGFAMRLPPPIATLIGFEPIHVERGAAVFRLDARREKHGNPMGTVHGGILCDVADGAMGMACASLLELGESFTTIELRITFLRPVLDATLEARARVVNGGKSLVYLECEIVSAVWEEKLVAKASSTCLILRGNRLRGADPSRWRDCRWVDSGVWTVRRKLRSSAASCAPIDRPIFAAAAASSDCRSPPRHRWA